MAPKLFMETTIAITSSDIAFFVYSVVFLAGVIVGWAFVLGAQQRF
jgi:hypothetical protein